MKSALSRTGSRATIAVAIAGIAGALQAGSWSAQSLHPAGCISSWASSSVGSRQFGSVEIRYPEQSRTDLQAVGWVGSATTTYSLHPSSERFSAIYAADESGQVGDSYGWSTYRRASLWRGTASSLLSLAPLGYPNDSATLGIGDGQQVGWVAAGGRQQAAMWTSSADSWINLHPISVLGISMSEARDASAGRQVGWIRVGDVSHASLWAGSAASWVDLHPNFATSSVANAIEGSVQVGFVTIDNVPMACEWNDSASSCVILAPPGATMSWANATSLGEHIGVVGFSIASFERATMWSGGRCIDLHALTPSVYESSEAVSISRAGANTYVTGGVSRPFPATSEAFLWIRCGADLNDDRIVDDTDFVGFADQYQIFLCDAMPDVAACPSDFNRDHVVDDADFVMFADSYEAFLCP